MIYKSISSYLDSKPWIDHPIIQATFLRPFLLGILVALMIYFAMLGFIFQAPLPLVAAHQMAFVLVTALFLTLLRWPKLSNFWISQLLTLGLYIHFTYAAWLTGGIHSIALDWLALLPACTLLLGTASTLFWGACSLILLGCFALMSALNWHQFPLPEATYALWGWTISIGISVNFIAHSVLYDWLHTTHMKRLVDHQDKLQSTQEQLKQTQSHKDAFIAAVSHELRTPIHAILGFTTLLRDHLQLSAHALSLHIENSCHDLLRIISDILDFSQLQASKLFLTQEWHDPAQFIKEAHQRAQSSNKKSELIIQCQANANLPSQCFFDTFRLAQVIDHVLSNAMKFSNQGVVELRAFANSTHWVIEIQDRGIGIAKDDLKHIFKGFQHANSEIQHRYGGTGLGLAISQAIIDLHEGSLEVDSQLGQGTLVRISLPIKPDAIALSRTKAADKKAPVSLAQRFNLKWWLQRCVHAIDEITEDKARLFAFILIGTALNLTYYEFIAPFPEAKFGEFVLASSLIIIAIRLFKNRKLSQAFHWVNSVCAWGIVYLSFYSGGIFSPVSSWAHLLCVSPVYLGTRREQLFWLIGTALILAFLSIATYLHLLPFEPNQTPMFILWSTSGHISILFLLFCFPLIYKFRINRSEQKLRLQNIELMLIQDVLIEEQRLKDQFIATLNHAMRTPLNAMMGFNDLIKDQIQTQQGQEIHAITTQSNNHLLTVINDILDLSHFASGQLTLKRSVFHLPNTLNQIFQMFDTVLTNPNVIKRIELRDIPDWVLGDSQRLTQIIVNLLNNAVKFTQQGEICLRVYSNDLGIQFEVIDTGVGISKEKLPHIFDPFEQINAQQHRKNGNGLGLSITKRLIEAQQGQISVQSALNVGTTFKFHISLTTCPAPNLARETPTASAREDHEWSILVVDDQHLNRLLAKQVLIKTWPHVKLYEAVDGRDALAQLTDRSFDLVLMDVIMPDLDGIGATQLIRSTLPSPQSQVPILGLTANAYETTRQQCLQAGMNALMFKPFQREELIQQIMSLLAHANDHDLKEKSPSGNEAINFNSPPSACTY